MAATLLSEEEIADRLRAVDGWEHAEGAIRKTFKHADFEGSVDFVNRLTPAAEELGHHPDLQISWNRVTVSLRTHDAGGVTARDFELAGRIDALA